MEDTMTVADNVLNYFNQNFQAGVQACDLNHDSMVDQNEMIRILQNACVPYCTAVNYAQQIFCALDKNHDGVLSAADCRTQAYDCISQNVWNWVERVKCALRQNPQAIFCYANLNHDCYVTESELSSYLNNQGLGCYEAGLVARQLFCELDRDRNGVLTIQEMSGC
jgi:Ca2+-binding EF-hand superfamily protein